MFNRYRRCCCQNNYNPQVIEKICNNVGTKAEYADTNCMQRMYTNCGCNCSSNSMKDDDMECCGCGFEEETSPFPSNPMLAQSYVPIQKMNQTFTPCCGLKMGTIYPELVSPYSPGQSMEEIQYLKKANEIGEGCNR